MEMVKTILAVDDDPAVLAYLHALLADHYVLMTTSEPSQVAALAREHRPDLVISDIDMPDMDGGEVAQQLALDPLTRTIPLLYLTSIVSPGEARQMGGMVGGRPGVSKQASAAELLRRIRALIPD